MVGFFCLQARLFTKKGTGALGRALWADSALQRVGTIASHVQFKPIRIGENLVVNLPRKKAGSIVPARDFFFKPACLQTKIPNQIHCKSGKKEQGKKERMKEKKTIPVNG